MCGIWAYLQLSKSNLNHSVLYDDFMSLKARGPDLSIFHCSKNVIVGFHRLAVIDPTFHANQPYIMEDEGRTIMLVCNGEIYNFKELNTAHQLEITDNSDCMVIPKLYLKYVGYNHSGANDVGKFIEVFKKQVKAEFSFILFEFDRFQNVKEVLVGRDEIGIRPLYQGISEQSLRFSSEVKGMASHEGQISEFRPGTIKQVYLDSFGSVGLIRDFCFRSVYEAKPSLSESESGLLEKVRIATINAIRRRLVADRPLAFLLSGGVDSSLIAAISAKILNQPIKTFCCGMSEGTDLLFARKVANHIGSHHTEVMFTPEDGLQAIKDVIYTTETWDTTTIRASVGQYLVCKFIGERTDLKVVLVGEGPDEVCSSYLFNYYAPSGKELHETALEYVEKIHMYDGRRADRCISRWGLEGRISLLDPEFIKAYWSIPADWRMPSYKGIEKWWLRKAFDKAGILPSEVLWRRKEAFSDGVSSKEKPWFQIIQEFVDTQVSDKEFQQENRWECPSKEAYFYKKVFVEFFGEKRLDILPHYWQPKWDSTGKASSTYIDPSARVLNIYSE